MTGSPDSLTSRNYRSLSDLQDMLDMLMVARRQTGDWRYPHVGELMWNFFMLLIHLDPCRHIRLWYAGGNRLVAYAMLGEDPSFDWQVLPQYEWRGIEDQALAWAEDLQEELRRSDPKGWGGDLGCGSRQDNSLRIAFLDRHGFIYSGRFAEVNMLRSLEEPIPEIAVPPGYRVRALLPSEIPDWAAVQREVWQPWTVGNVSDDDYQRLARLPGYLPELEVVTVAPQGLIASQVTGWIDPLNRIGDLGPVGARQAYRRQGLTRLALLECLRRFKVLGMDRACISTGFSNTPALNLYESLGFRVVNRYLDFVRPG